jgi:hypothetical protein
METHTTFQPSYSSAIQEAELVWPGTIWMLQRPISLSGHVINSATGKPVEAEIKIEDIIFPNDEKFFSEPTYGRYHLFLPAGTYTVEFSADKYESQSFEITITQDSAELLDVELERITEPPEIPEISGPLNGLVGETLEYSLFTTDPDGDDVFYLVDWDDGTIPEWIGPFNSGFSVNITHKWNQSGDYDIRVKARDIYLAESDFSYPLTIHISGPILEIGNILGGLFNVRTNIKNIGDLDANNIQWTINLDGSILIGKETSGSITNICDGEKYSIKSNLVIGFGPIVISVDVEIPESSATKQRNAYILLFLIL